MRESISKHEGEKRKVRDLQVQLAESESGNKILEKDLWRCQEDLRSVTEKLENGGGADLTTTNISTNDTMPLPMSSPLKNLSPSPPPLSQSSYKLPSYKLVGSVKRALSPEQDDEERSPFMPIMNHKSKRLATDQGPARCVNKSLAIVIISLLSGQYSFIMMALEEDPRRMSFPFSRHPIARSARTCTFFRLRN